MVLHLSVDKPTHTDFTPRITVFGVGGGGCNAVNNMIEMNLPGVEFVVANTDAQQLQRSLAEKRIQLGPHLTQGNGAGGRPDIGKLSADEAADELARHLENTHMVFITAGMGGGTGTGAAPVIARMARERDILTVGVVTKPFAFEGKRRMRAAEEGIIEMQAYVDTLIVIPNQNLFKVANERTGWKEAFEMADNVLYMGVRGVTDLMVMPGIVNLDFADVRSVMREMGKAMMGTGEAEGDDRAIRAAEAAISNPLLEDTNMKGARGLLINITGASDVTLFEIDQAANRVSEEVDTDANIMFGMSLDETMSGRIRVSVVATGIDSMPAALPNLKVVNGGAENNNFVQAVSTQNAQQQVAGASRPAGYVPEPPASPIVAKAYVERTPEAAPAEAPVAAEPQYQQPAPRPAAPVRASAPAPTPVRAPEPPKPTSIFKSVFGFGSHKNTAPAPQPHRQEPAMRTDEAPHEEPRPSVRPAQVDEVGLEIPAFLRRNQ
ncbi:cell division protein FtsZ [Acidocella aminolytica]|uniref:Cell division protein FtsZ n=1 Tax=Acidocella aminolytica 101 = DSM 11237 TaxID=1120923 RepID=A0A0D6PEB2_9PROT|nr:cell division protein FtsZ [Acidocella aminolytica]GAN79189.1 cell division protein FtsZ [Acidocella aminolytica 101 = DSM 11237]GBQ40735.1 cell division protein FtsZ [Acidocella aminolytica 101 = DSM 11237]SHE91507.1 cell division protein FtsZ [Acidocella aminolytica 101 = DSM 11237]